MRPTQQSGSMPTSAAGLGARDTVPSGCDTYGMREGATLKLDSGEEVRVDVDRDDLDRDEIVLRRLGAGSGPLEDRLAVIDQILATASPRPAGTTDRWLAADRER